MQKYFLSTNEKKILSPNCSQRPHSWRQLRGHFSTAQLRLGDNHVVNQYHTVALSSTLGVNLYLGICLSNQVLLGFVDECVLLPFTLLERGGNGTISVFVNTDLEPAVTGLGGLTPGCDCEGLGGGANGCGLLDKGQEVLSHGYLTRGWVLVWGFLEGMNEDKKEEGNTYR